jgi:hypothetical protein
LRRPEFKADPRDVGAAERWFDPAARPRLELAMSVAEQRIGRS